ncbi:MAG: outer membrane beta-barrel protein [Cyclobacteriaceae bacterium]
MGRPQFEDSWKGVFEGAESAVPDSVWDKVEMDLVRMENKTNKTRVVFYQRLAAMVALFALMMASYIAYDRTSDDGGALQIAQQNQSSENSEANLNSNTTEAKPVLETPDTEGVRGKNTGVPTTRVVAKTNSTNTSTVGNSNLMTAPANVNTQKSYRQSDLTAFIPDWPAIEVKLKSKGFYEPNFPRELPAMPSYLMASSKNDNANEAVYASLGFAGGSYNPGTVASEPSSLSRMASQSSFISAQAEPQSARATIGTAYSIGVNTGKQLSKRWAVQGGLGYMVQNIDYTSNYTSIAPDNTLRAAVTEYADTETMIAIGPPYSIRSINKYLSIPVQVGYKLVDRKIGLQLNAGMATDLFLSNTLKDESGMTESFTQGAGKESPYRSVNWSGLMGLELSHKLAERYRVALVPGIRYTFNSALKDNTQVSYNPFVLDVGLRVKYIFK